MRLGNSFQLSHYQRRDHRAVFRQLMFPPTDRKITPERLAVVEIGADYRSFKISAWLHDVPLRSLLCAFGRCVAGGRTWTVQRLEPHDAFKEIENDAIK